MTYSTLLVHLDAGSANDSVLRVAATLAVRFKAKVIGIAASQPMPIMYAGGEMCGDLIDMDLAEIVKETTEAETSFRTALRESGAELEWRSAIANEQLADYVTREARAADLVITGPDQGWSAFDTTRRVVVSTMVLKAGRPVMVVPHGAPNISLESVVVAWKDTREARRAIVDALPLLKQASRVFVLEITSADDVDAARHRLVDVAGWLDRHGIVCDNIAATSAGNDAAQIAAFALDKAAGVIVAGAFGHNRLREWVLGGVTRDLLVHPVCCSFVSC
ncbi:universal stress protein [Lichenihabitans psoromatis]|uniref:universal stress protein n=1 Tax=Lichenihabitans psoromatis TaxID=2528642 RepID=UPI0010357926|nr:universal stress protein [Lichenihabitans psoromatis]